MSFEEFDETDLDYWVNKDLPLRLCFDVVNKDIIRQRLKDAGLPDLLPRWMFTRMALFAELVRAFPTGKWTSYSRRKMWYAGKSGYFPVPFSYEIMRGIVDQAADYGLIYHYKAKPRAIRQSKMMATQKLVDIFTDVDMDYVNHGVIRLTEQITPTETEIRNWKSRNRKNRYRNYKPKNRLISFEETDETRKIESDVHKINSGLSEVRLQCPGLFEQDQKYVNSIGSFLKFDDKCVLVTDLKLHRSFCRGSFDKGGRFYGWYQSQPKETRSRFLIDWETVCEPDFSRYHPHILYALRGIQLEKDPYDVPGCSVELAKIAFLVLPNAKTERDAVGALMSHFLKKGIMCNPQFMKILIQNVREAHPLIADDLHNDRGVDLQKVDSDIMNDIMLCLTEENIVGLPVHDSIICKVSTSHRVKEIMREAYARRFPGMTCPVK